MTMKQLAKWRRECARQRKEHPSLPTWAIRQIASDHIHIKKNKG